MIFQSPTTTHDMIQLKQLYVSCQQRKSELMKDLETLKQENQKLSNQSNVVRITCTGMLLLIKVVPLLLNTYVS
jgi:benzoyl-CoA reductase/2-hydroxyglutaryl-CoA dehydratase subunit BcrC/BadD/HgdB